MCSKCLKIFSSVGLTYGKSGRKKSLIMPKLAIHSLHAVHNIISLSVSLFAHILKYQEKKSTIFMKNIHYIGNWQDPGYSSTKLSFIFMMHPGETTEYFQLFQDAVRDCLSEKGCCEFNKL